MNTSSMCAVPNQSELSVVNILSVFVCLFRTVNVLSLLVLLLVTVKVEVEEREREKKVYSVGAY